MRSLDVLINRKIDGNFTRNRNIALSFFDYKNIYFCVAYFFRFLFLFKEIFLKRMGIHFRR